MFKRNMEREAVSEERTEVLSQCRSYFYGFYGKIPEERVDLGSEFEGTIMVERLEERQS